MTIQTIHFGRLEIEDEETILFPQGLPGFEECRRFVPLHRAEVSGLVFLQSLEQPGLCFVAVVVRPLWPEYELWLSGEDREVLGLDGEGEGDLADDVVALAVLSFTEGEPPTANLLAPVAICWGTRRALQVVRRDERYSLREPLPAMEEASCS